MSDTLVVFLDLSTPTSHPLAASLLLLLGISVIQLMASTLAAAIPSDSLEECTNSSLGSRYPTLVFSQARSPCGSSKTKFQCGFHLHFKSLTDSHFTQSKAKDGSDSLEAWKGHARCHRDLVTLSHLLHSAMLAFLFQGHLKNATTFSSMFSSS